MTLTIRDIRTPIANSVHPVFIIHFIVKLHVDPTQPDPFTVNTGEIRLTANVTAKATIQRVVPNIELPRERCVHSGDEIHGIVHNVDHVFISTDPVKGRHFVIGQLIRLPIQPPAGMGEANDRPLSFAPLKNWQVPAWPILNLLGARVVLVFEAEQNQVSCMAGRETGDLQVVAHQVVRRRELVNLGLKKLLLEIVARTPGKDTADI